MRSIIQNTGGDYEVLVVDDNSTDGSTNNLPEQISLIKCATRRVGAIAARQMGISAMSPDTDVVVFLDGHTEVLPGWLDNSLATLSRNPGALVTGALEQLIPNAGPAACGVYVNDMLEWKWISETDLPQNRDVEIQICPGGFMVMDHETLDLLDGGFDNGLRMWGSEDIELSLRCWGMGRRVVANRSARIKHKWADTGRNHVNWHLWLYNLLRTATMHFADFGSVGKIATHYAIVAGTGPVSLALRDLQNDVLFQRRLANYKQKRVRDAQWVLDNVSATARPYLQEKRL